MTFFYVYILRNDKNGRWYTGCTKDLRKRVSRHSVGRGGYTKDTGPYSLIYYEASRTLEDSIARERYLKSGMGKRYVKNRLKHFLSLTG
jgi:putative endonuclease